MGCLGKGQGEGSCHTGSPVLVDSSKREKHLQEDFKHPRLFSPFSIFPIPCEGGNLQQQPWPSCSWVTLGKFQE